MKRGFNYIIIIFLVISSGCTVKKNILNDANAINNNSDTGGVQEENFETDKDHIAINEISFGTQYKKVVEVLGEPNDTIPITDEAIVVNKGYFSVLEYEGLQLVVSVNENYELLENSDVVELDVLNDAYSTSKGIRCGSTKEEVKELYELDDNQFFMKEDSAPIGKSRIAGLRRERLPFEAYDEYCLIEKDDYPVALVILFNEEEVVRILIRHLTAD